MTEIVQNNNGMKFDLLEPGNSETGISGSEGLFNSLLGSVDTHSENDLQECNKLENEVKSCSFTSPKSIKNR